MIDWIELEYPDTVYIVDVKYSGDIGITTCRCNRSNIPPEKDNAYGFTSIFRSYDAAKRYARRVAQELGIPTVL